MEITFEFEDEDFDIVFIPDDSWLHNKNTNKGNKADHSKVQWELQNRSGTTIMADVQYELPDETTDYVIYLETDVV
jgi:hypothetical protein